MTFVFGADLESLGIKLPTWTALGWARRVDELLAPPGKTLRRGGQLNMSRAQFRRLRADHLAVLQAAELRTEVWRIPWGAFVGEEYTASFEEDGERLRIWCEAQED